jgi:1-deoxy-D-xylulose-5-phosphate synthase
MVSVAEAAAHLLEEEGISARVVDMRWAKPLDLEAIEAATQTRAIVTLEEGVICGGVGEEVVRHVNALGAKVPVCTLGIPDEFISQGPIPKLLEEVGLAPDAVAARVKDLLK